MKIVVGDPFEDEDPSHEEGGSEDDSECGVSCRFVFGVAGAFLVEGPGYHRHKFGDITK